MPLPWLSSSPSSSSPNSQNQQQNQPQNQQRRLTRAKQLRHLKDRDLHDLDFSLTCSSSSPLPHPRTIDSQPPPHPLPLPDLSSLFSRSDKNKIIGANNPNSNPNPKSYNNNNHTFFSLSSSAPDLFRLPSPNESGKEKDKPRLKIKDIIRSSDQPPLNDSSAPRESLKSIDGVQRGDDPQRSIHRAETWSSNKVPKNIKNMDQAQENLNIDIGFRSAPPSTNASPMLSPQRMFNGDPFSSYPVEPKSWSDPAMPTNFQAATLAETHRVSCDSSPFRSPLVKNQIPHRSNNTGPTSPRHPKLSINVMPMHLDNNALMNVHPLPRPPTPTSSTQTSPVPQVTVRPEFLPMKRQWIKGKLIGRGTFGSVYVATNRETGALCAMKEVELFPDDPKSAECIRQLEQEIKFLSDLKNPNIVQYYGSEIVNDRFYIYLEYVYPGSINKYVREHCGAITESVIRNFTRHILSGLAYLHGRKTIHRDIEGANLLVNAFGVVKLADFGMAKHLTGQMTDLSLKGSPYWMAPELMDAMIQKDNNSDLAFAVDIWSLGCTIIEMLTGRPPWSEYEGAAAMFKVLRESPPIPETLSSEGRDFLRCCFRRNPAERPPASKLLDHPFLRNSQQVDVQSSSLVPSPSNLNDRAHSFIERYDRKLDRVPLSPNLQASNGKGNNNETSPLSDRESPELTVNFRQSPRSILEPSNSSPPPWTDLSFKPLVSSNASNDIYVGAEKTSVYTKLCT